MASLLAMLSQRVGQLEQQARVGGEGLRVVERVTRVAAAAVEGGRRGSVPFFTGSTLGEDNGSFFYDRIQRFLGIGTNAPQGTLHVAGSRVVQTRGMTVSGVVGPLDEMVFADATVAELTVTLTAGVVGRRLGVVKVDATPNAVLMTGVGRLTVQGESVLLISDGSLWWVL